MKEVYCMDAKEYISSVPSLPSVITSLPDAEETGMKIDEWEIWFIDMCESIMKKTVDEGYAIFYQTDRKYKGGLIDKSFFCTLAAEKANVKMVFHKIVLKTDPNKTLLFRPSYTHLLCYSGKSGVGKPTPDVIYAGRMLYNNAMGMNACRFACRYVKQVSTTVVDPFCGKGSVLAIANSMGLKAVGIDIDEKQCAFARDYKIATLL